MKGIALILAVLILCSSCTLGGRDFTITESADGYTINCVRDRITIGKRVAPAALAVLSAPSSVLGAPSLHPGLKKPSDMASLGFMSEDKKEDSEMDEFKLRLKIAKIQAEKLSVSESIITENFKECDKFLGRSFLEYIF